MQQRLQDDTAKSMLVGEVWCALASVGNNAHIAYRSMHGLDCFSKIEEI